MRTTGRYLQSAGRSTFYQEDCDRAKESFINMGGGDSEQAELAASNIMSASLMSNVMGTELLWLARVLPEVAGYDWDTWNSQPTLARAAFRENCPFYTGMNFPVIDQFHAQDSVLIAMLVLMAHQDSDDFRMK